MTSVVYDFDSLRRALDKARIPTFSGEPRFTDTDILDRNGQPRQTIMIECILSGFRYMKLGETCLAKLNQIKVTGEIYLYDITGCSKNGPFTATLSPRDEITSHGNDMNMFRVIG